MMVLNQFEITNNIDNVLITIFTRSLYMLTTMVLRRVLIHTAADAPAWDKTFPNRKNSMWFKERDILIYTTM